MTPVIGRFDAIALVVLLPALVIAWRRKLGELTSRALTLLGLLAVVTLAMAFGRAGMFVLAVLILLGGALELAHVGKVAPVLGLAAAVVGFAAPLVRPVPEAISLGAFLVVLAAMVVAERPLLTRSWFVAAMEAGLLGVGLGFLVRLDSLGSGAIVVLVLVLQFSDGLGYAVGGRLGRTHPFPGLSPGKSVEGYVAGLVGAALAVGLLATVDPVLRPAAWPGLALLGSALVVTANAGDLLMSRVKRSAKVKDFGHLLPGHGGVLDRFDGWLTTAPVLYVLCIALPVLARRP